MSSYIVCYTRVPNNEKLYDPKLAYSMHLAISEEGKQFKPLNNHSGVLFALATENEDGSLNAKGIQKPYLFYLKDGSFGVVAIRVEGEGQGDEESKGSVLFFKSKDLVSYEEWGLLQLNENHDITDVMCDYEQGEYVIRWCDGDGIWYVTRLEELVLEKGIGFYEKANVHEIEEHLAELGEEAISEQLEESMVRNKLLIAEEVSRKLVQKLCIPENTGIHFPENVKVHSAEALQKIKALATYSDGTTDDKKVHWDLSDVDWQQVGRTYTLTGKVHQDHYEFPIAFNRADPCVTKWGENYYFIATNDADGNHSLYIREADTLSGLVQAEEKLLIDSDTYEEIKGLLWAPEFHEIEGALYIFHAATPHEFFYEESHVMALKKGGNPACREDWSRPHRVVKKDGSFLCEAGKTISLDMTCFKWEKEYYVIWSQREFLPKDLGAWLYIAKVDPKKPWQLITEPVLLSKPDYGWANNHTFVDEGPFALIRGNRLFVTFSSAAVDYSYVVGLLSIEQGMDLMKRENWKKKNYPILTGRSVEGEVGTGHNAYVIDDEGVVWNTYHARLGAEGVRSSGIRRVHFDCDGEPVLALTEEKDLKADYSQVTTMLTVARA